MGCLTVTISRVGDGVNASYTPVTSGMGVSFTPVDSRLQAAFSLQETGMAAAYTRSGGMKVRYGLVCGTNLGDGFLYASDALLITIENGKLKVQGQ